MVYILLSITLFFSIVSTLFSIFLFIKNKKDKETQNIDSEKISQMISESIYKSNNEMLLKFNQELSNQNIKQYQYITDTFNTFQNSLMNSSNANNIKFNDSINQNINNLSIKLEEKIDNLTKNQTKSILDFQDRINNNINQNLNALNAKVDNKLQDINTKVDSSLKEGFNTTKDTMLNLEKQLTSVKDTQNNISELQKDIVSLGNILSNNQTRGKYGEMQLELLLKDILGNTQGSFYDFQYVISDKSSEEKLKPDAVIFLDGKERKMLLPIDSKFSLVGYEDLFDYSKVLTQQEKNEKLKEFKKAIKLRIDECSKYNIENSIKQTIMFIPSDSIFSFVMSEFKDISDYAKQKQVVITSPTLLSPLLASFKIVLLEEKKRENVDWIDECLNKLSAEFIRFKKRWDSLENQISTLNNTTSQVSTTVNKITKNFNDIKEINSDEIDENDKISIVN